MMNEETMSGLISSTIDSDISLPLQNQDVFGSSSQLVDGAGSSVTHLIRSLLFSLSILKDKIHEIESFENIFLVQQPGNYYHNAADELALSSMAHLMHEILESASYMILNFQQRSRYKGSSLVGNNCDHKLLEHQEQVVLVSENEQGLLTPHVGGVIINKGMSEDIYQETVSNYNGDNSFSNWYTPEHTSKTASTTTTTTRTEVVVDHIVEIEASDLLARYTHYCHICGRGFKREANLKMHMRAHGDQYKLSSLRHLKNNSTSLKLGTTRYSCPHQGCRWNKKHAKFQPLKSIVCVRNHYKRSHCPKMFMCNRCNMKQFSVLSDLKTHEKHCGDVAKWYCSCGTFFYNKGKLMDHVELFVGHTPLVKNPFSGFV